jgi:hypothetical protein
MPISETDLEAAREKSANGEGIQRIRLMIEETQARGRDVGFAENTLLNFLENRGAMKRISPAS